MRGRKHLLRVYKIGELPHGARYFHRSMKHSGVMAFTLRQFEAGNTLIVMYQNTSEKWTMMIHNVDAGGDELASLIQAVRRVYSCPKMKRLYSGGS